MLIYWIKLNQQTDGCSIKEQHTQETQLVLRLVNSLYVLYVPRWLSSNA